MKQTSKTGLTASPTKRVPRFTDHTNVQLKPVTKPAPYILKPYSGLYNPYSDGCSLLCNHPLDKETRELFKKAKDNWTNDGKPEVLSSHRDNKTPQFESVPEELFRRYTETDSRPLTPAPTLASGATKASGSRRCVTPEATRPKAQLVLDLRRTHSQETISYSASLHEPPLIRIQHVPTRTASLEEIVQHRPAPSTHSLPIHSPRKSKTASDNTKINLTIVKTEKEEEVVNDEEEDVKRRGKKKKKKARELSGGPFQGALDPETQVAAIGDSNNPSARASVVPLEPEEEVHNSKQVPKIGSHKSLDVDSYLSKEILKQLRRELNEEVVDNELNLKRRKALEEALKAVSKDRVQCDGLSKLQQELKVPPLNADLWICLPRTFSRSSCRFELPMDSRTLSSMTPLDYAKEHVAISSERKLLFNCIFNRFKMEAELENEHERKLSGQSLQDSLDLLMGRPMNSEESTSFRDLIGWKDEDVFDFRTFCGVAALCERLMAKFFCPKLPDRVIDRCHEIETADFEVLTRKVGGRIIDERLMKILNEIKIL